MTIRPDAASFHTAGAASPATAEADPRRLVSTPWEGTLEARVAELLTAGEAVVLVTVISSAGSSPRHAGTRALQTRQGFEGTVGGGILEARTMEAARQCLEERHSLRASFVFDASSPDSDMVCGGRIEVLCECLEPGQAGMFALADAVLQRGGRGAWLVSLGGAHADSGNPVQLLPERRLAVAQASPASTASLPKHVTADLETVLPLLERRKSRPGLVDEAGHAVYAEPLTAPPVLLLCGGGHVSLAVARLAQSCGFTVDVADDREEFANARRFPMARRCHVLPAFAGLAERCGIGRRHYVAIMTRGHAFDKEALAQVLATPAAYIGMIGSTSKREHVYAALRAEGVPEAALRRVCCPIGLDVKAETPQQIAVSVVAELLAAEKGTLPLPRKAERHAPGGA